MESTQQAKDALNSNVNINDVQLNGNWNSDDDMILKEWVDKSSCLHWLHERSYKRYKRQYLRQMIPVIIISTLTGSANFAQNMFEDYAKLASVVIGSMNIVVGILTTIYQFLKISELSESHKAAALSWGKFYEYIKLEISKDEIDKDKVLNYCAEQYQHLIEFSPSISEDIINQYRDEKGESGLPDVFYARSNIPDLLVSPEIRV